MKTKILLLQSFACALGVLVYVYLISLLASIKNKPFDGDPLLAVPFVLLLFIISATITGSLVLGKPIMLFISGKKKEAITFFLSVLGWLILSLLLIVCFIFSR
ncbi:MAG: hypothetical protein WC477_06725 [Patescibacteria group bacterium]